MLEIRPIRTEADHKAALAEVERLFDAKPDTPEVDRLEVWVLLVVAYEKEHYPIPPPAPTATYCQEADTLFIRLPGFGRLHAAHQLTDDVYALIDVETEEAVGIQIENWKRHHDLFRAMVRQTDAEPRVPSRG